MSAKAKRILALLKDPRHRARLVAGVNRIDQDEPAQVGKDQGMKVLREMNELQEFENDNWNRGVCVIGPSKGLIRV